MAFWERDYYPLLANQPESTRLLEIKACWTTAFGSGRRPEGVLWQRIHDIGRLVDLFRTELPAERKAPGTYISLSALATSLEYRDQWESRLLRTAPWSPWS